MNIVSDLDLKIIKRIPFESVDFVFDGLYNAFHPDGSDEELDPKFLSLWHLFLACIGWSEDEYWEEHKIRYQPCAKCQEEINKSSEKSN